jgi:hypothetical protein
LKDKQAIKMTHLQYDTRRKYLKSRIRGAENAIAIATDPKYTPTSQVTLGVLYAYLDKTRSELSALRAAWAGQNKLKERTK